MYEILYSSGKAAYAPSLTAARTSIADHFGRDRREVGFDDRSSSCGDVEQYDVWLAGGGDRVATITAEDSEASDPLLGVSPDEIVVGAGGQTLAQAAEAERESPARRAVSTAYAVVLPPPDGRPILLRPNLVRYAYGLWPAGFAGEVVGVIVDAGTGTTEADIRAALTVTVLDPVFASDVAGCATDHVWCELDRLRTEAERADTAIEALL